MKKTVAFSLTACALVLGACTPTEPSAPEGAAEPVVEESATVIEPTPIPETPAAVVEPAAVPEPGIPEPTVDQPQEVTGEPGGSEAMPGEAASSIQMTELPPFTAGAYQIQPKYEDALSDGHINLTVTGGEIGAVRMWVGGEDPTNALVVKAEIENDYYHGHIEMPDPIPADARLWAEIENPAGETFKGSTTLQ